MNIGLNFYSGSLTPWTNINPSFNVIIFDAEYMIPINIKTYYIDLVQTNQANTASWTMLHDYLSYYSLPNMSPDSIYNLALKIRDNENAAIQY